MNKKSNEIKVPKKYFAVNDKNKKFEVRYPLTEEPKVNGKVVNVKIVDNENGFGYIMWKNKKYNVQILEKNQNKYHILFNGVSYRFTIETPISYKRRKFLDKNKEASKTEFILAPMPGKIVEVSVEEGDKINAGEPVITLEAMKMQNEIVSHVGGTVHKIHVKAEDLVMKEDMMIEIIK
jgi:glutaconyl-CoA/methylmalonyl-CoA decarboxylase subunit gamma